MRDDVIIGSPSMIMVPAQPHRDVPILSNDSLKSDAILAFAERPLMAINGH